MTTRPSFTLLKILAGLAAATAVFLAKPAAGDIFVPNAGFETPVVGGGQFQYSPSGGAWSFGGGTGISGNGSGFTASNPAAPEGTQVVFIQGTGRFSQQLTNFTANVPYTLRFLAAQRSYGQPGQTWNVQLDGQAIGGYAPPQSATSYTEYSATFATSAGSHTLAFQGVNGRGGDNTVFIDNVRIITPPKAEVALEGGQVRIGFAAEPWRSYFLEYKEDLRSPGWLRFNMQDYTAGPLTSFAITGPADRPQRFYRVGTGVNGSLPQPWESRDIGSVGSAGNATYTNGVLTIKASGADIWDQADAFRFVHQNWTGDVEVISRVVTVQNTDGWAKSGVMVRESLAADSRHALMVVTPSYGTSFQRRTNTAAASLHTTPADGVTAPYWVRLVRSGDTLTGYKSATGTSWTTVGSDTVPMSTNVYIGVVACAHNSSVLGQATLDNVIVRAPVFNMDYDGHYFVTQAAPVLTFQRKLAPALTGIDYAFPEQTAHGVALLSRFPGFTLSDCRLHVDGPWYDSPAANLHFTRGISSVGAIPRYRENDNAPTTMRKIPQERKWTLMTDPMWWQHAVNYANELAAQNPADPRIGPLRTFGTNHVFVNDQNTFVSLGYRVFQMERGALDSEGKFARYPAIDIETTGNWEYQRNCFGWLYQGLAQGATELGVPLVPMLYGQWQYSVGAFYESMRQGGTGDPEYLLPEKDFLAAPDPTLIACQQNNGILSMDGYLQAMWGREPFFKRNADGSLQLAGGLPVFNDITNTTAYGWQLYLEPGEAKHCLDDLYRQAVRMYLQHYRRAGQYPANSALRKSFLSNCRIGAWSRYTNEGMQGINQNDRPLPDWLLDTLIGLYLFTADDITVWSSDMNFIPGPLGGDYTAAWRYNTHGVLESVVKAAHRYSVNEPLHATGGTWQWCWFNLPVINKNETARDRYFEKPIAIGKLRPFEGHTWLELYLAWPALDGTAKSFKVWIDQSGQRSSAYTVQIPNGRTYFYDAWQLPDTFTNLQGQHIWLRTTDLLGVQRTWRGDWRVTADNTIATPGDF